jgi:hypothetical protein
MNYRFYSFVNFYLTGIHPGIQSGHVHGELFNKYVYKREHGIDDPAADVLKMWNFSDKTYIVLDGGMTSQMEKEWRTLRELGNDLKLPFAAFYEDPRALGVNGHGIMTAYGIVVPDKIYDLQCISSMTNGIGGVSETWVFDNDSVMINGIATPRAGLPEFKQDSVEVSLHKFLRSHKMK